MEPRTVVKQFFIKQKICSQLWNVYSWFQSLAWFRTAIAICLIDRWHDLVLEKVFFQETMQVSGLHSLILRNFLKTEKMYFRIHDVVQSLKINIQFRKIIFDICRSFVIFPRHEINSLFRRKK